MSIVSSYKKLEEEINKKALEAGRDPKQIEVVAVSKTFSAGIIQEAVDGGIKLFGENRVQEAKSKIPEIKGDFSFHLIGYLQSNKAKDAVKIFDLIHSIDKFSTASRVSREAQKIEKNQKILVQVNTSGEETKNGIEPDSAAALCRDILELPNLELPGLMTIGPFTEDKKKIRESFRMLKNILEEINHKLGLSMKELSMGMSSDYLIALEEGATILRIGSAIFGKRGYSYDHAEE